MDDKLVDYFIKETNKRFDNVDERFDKVDKQIERLINFRLLLIGAAVGISGLVSAVFQILMLLYGNGK